MNTDITTISVANGTSVGDAINLFLSIWLKNQPDRNKQEQAEKLLLELEKVESDPMEYIATFKSSSQISPDEWNVFNPSLKINSNTRVSDIEKFYTKHGHVSPMQVSIIQLENI